MNNEFDDMDLIAEEARERYNRHMQRRLASCGDSEYPQHLAQQDIVEAEQERQERIEHAEKYGREIDVWEAKNVE